MTTKTCAACKVTKPLGDFYKHPNTYCKPCHITKVRNRQRELARCNMEKIIAYFADHPCVDCGEEDWQILEFDHRDPKFKTKCVSSFVWRNSWEDLRHEIDKCDVRCANCHRKRTAIQLGHYAYFDPPFPSIQ